jgi:hypothetical protein
MFTSLESEQSSVPRSKVLQRVAFGAALLGAGAVIAFATGTFASVGRLEEEVNHADDSMVEPEQGWAMNVVYSGTGCSTTSSAYVQYLVPDVCGPATTGYSKTSCPSPYTSYTVSPFSDSACAVSSGASTSEVTPGVCTSATSSSSKHYCYDNAPAGESPLYNKVDQWTRYLFGSEFADSSCLTRTAVVYHALDKCIPAYTGTGSQKYVYNVNEDYTISSYTSSDCSGTATVSAAVHMGDCKSMGNGLYSKFNIIAN